MAIIAVAGGTGQLGQLIVEALKTTTSHTVYILSRSSNDEVSNRLKVPVFPVDYTNVGSLAKVLNENRIDIVISTVQATEDAGNSQLNLIEAAVQSQSTKRFIPSDFGVPFHDFQLSAYAPLQWKLKAHQRLKTSGLEYTLVSNGFLMDFYASPKVKSVAKGLTLFVDMANNAAAIPGTGDVPVAFTYSLDVSKYVAALVGEQGWSERSIIIGDKMTYKELVALAEAVKGTKFDIKYDSLDKLKTLQVTELPSHIPAYPVMPKQKLQAAVAGVGTRAAAGDANLPDEDTLNKRFPQIKPLTMREFLQKAWKS
ncbi:hypothetical protein AJ79_03261 [Helicocarpus griseus UAMH5409]|uniref:NmrA-like domain-containing protein n=1 Tax=Helicocarpus griseus UAMH5409 TaxID=1447875 RepID=A0A2B7XZD8_9EURO|nr:hypothetical protein AJ79_03261 [Helicocarpus griseus UAMH5409]